MDLSTLIDVVTGFFTGFFGTIVNIFIACVAWAFDGLVFVIGYALFYIFDGLLSSITVIVQAIDLSTFVVDIAGQVASLPSALLFLLHSCGFAQGMAIIASAYTIRLLLNLIPAAFTRI